MPAGAELAIGIAPGPGFRFYLGIDGGFDVPLLFGSRATYTMGALGGLDGRPLQQGDRLSLGERRGRPAAPARAAASPRYSREWEVRAMRGPQAAPDYLTEGDLETLFGRPWPSTRTPTGPAFGSSRTNSSGHGGAAGSPAAIPRTSSTTATRRRDQRQRRPPGDSRAGRADGGGFVVAATVIHADFWMIGQFRPVGDTVRFREVSLDEAVEADGARRDPDRVERGGALMEPTIKSPLPGTFYRRPNPQADPYVSEGDVLGRVTSWDWSRS